MTDKAAPIHPLVMAAGMGLFGFLASDFVDGRDGATASVEAVVREVMDLKLNPIIDDFRELKKEVREATSSARAVESRISQRMSNVENAMAVDAARYTALDERVERIGAIMRNNLKMIEGN